MGHLLRSLYRGPLGRKKLPLALPGAFSLAKLSGSPYLGAATLRYGFPRKPRRYQAAGFSYWAVTVVSSLDGRSAELSTKAGSLQGYGLWLWYFPQYTALIG